MSGAFQSEGGYMTELGAHLLGRIPSPPDRRDWKLSQFLGTDADIVTAAKAELFQTIVGYTYFKGQQPAPTTHWAKALALLNQIAPVPPPPVPSGDVVWQDPEPVLDQGNYGTCVGNGFAQWGNTLPIDDKYIEKDARAIYYEATIIDGSPDNPDSPGGGQQGATVRSGAKAMVARKRIGAYAFAASIDDVVAWLIGKGPVVFGTDWMDDMFYPDANGYVKPTGSLAGGHCFIARGYLAGENAILFRNSWGASWGLGGDFKMKLVDAKTLFAMQGEAVAAVELP
jgi:Papain family cysteine protease